MAFWSIAQLLEHLLTPIMTANSSNELEVLQGKGDGKGGKKAKPSATPEDKGKYLLDIVRLQLSVS